MQMAYPKTVHFNFLNSDKMSKLVWGFTFRRIDYGLKKKS